MPKKTDDTSPDQDPAVSVAGTSPDGEPIVAAPGQDVIQMTSLRKDGTPDQSPDYRFLDPVVGEELLALQQESLQSGADMVREKGPDVVRDAARARRDNK